MLSQYIRSSIIVMIQIVIPLLLLLLLTSQLLHFSQEMNQVHHFFISSQRNFFMIRSLFCLSLFLLWPKIIQFIVHRCHYEILPAQIRIAIKARWYLLATMVFYEVLLSWRAS